MKTSCTKAALSKALTITERAVGGRNTLPILQNALLTTEENTLRLSASNLEITITTQIPAKIEEPGAITVPVKLLSEFVSSLPGEYLELSINPDSSQVRIVSDRSEANISGAPAEDFPPLPGTDGGTVVEIDPTAMRTAIARTVFATASEDSRPVLTGVELRMSGNQFTMSAADGFRLAIQEGDLAQPVDEEISIIIPAKTMTEIHRFLHDHNDRLQLRIPSATKNVTFTLYKAQGQETITVTSMLVQGTFPNVQQIIPQSHNTRAVMDASSALRALRTAAIFAKNSYKIIRLEMKKAEEGANDAQATLKVSAESEEVGNAQQVVTLAEMEGDHSKIAFSSRYLLEVFSALDKDQVVLETTNSNSPGVFRPTNNNDYIYIVMPMFIEW